MTNNSEYPWKHIKVELIKYNYISMSCEFKKDQFSDTEYMNNIFLNPFKS